jgi:hypothetical protein
MEIRCGHLHFLPAAVQRDGRPARVFKIVVQAHGPDNGRRVSGERRAEGDERVRCTRVLGGRLLVLQDIEYPPSHRKPQRCGTNRCSA